MLAVLEADVLVVIAFSTGGQTMTDGCDILGKKTELKPLHTEAEK
jgi:hypothetical protein